MRPLPGIFLCLLVLLSSISLAQASSRPAVPAHTIQDSLSSLTPALQDFSHNLQSFMAETPAVSPNASEDIPEPKPNLGTSTLNLSLAAASFIYAETKTLITNLSTLPDLKPWIDKQLTDQKLLERWHAVKEDLLWIILPTLLFSWAIELLLIPIRRSLRARTYSSHGMKLRALTSLFALRALPIMTFVFLSYALIDPTDSHKWPRYIVLNCVYALALSRILVALIRGLFAPHVAHLRFLPLSNTEALLSYRWLSFFSSTATVLYFTLDVAHNIRVPLGSVGTFINVIGLILVALLAFLILQMRVPVRVWLHASDPKLPPYVQHFRDWLGKYWHLFALAYLLIGYLIVALGVQSGFEVMLRGTGATLLLILASHSLLRLIGKWHHGGDHHRIVLHLEVIKFLARVLILFGVTGGVLVAWGLDIGTWYETPLGQKIGGAVFSISVTLLGLSFLFEFINRSIEHAITRKRSDGLTHYASARTRTLLPMVRHIIFFCFASLAVLVTLSEAGLNIVPLLAGAGVVGVAIGFGSQTLVKDFLTGLFIVIENTVSIGDYVKIGDHAGFVEAMSIRTLRLRDNDGNLHILPFSEVSSLVNMTRDYSYAVIKIGVAYTTDIEKANLILHEVGEQLRSDPAFSHAIISEAEVLGIEALGDYAITLYARLKCRPAHHWDVRRAYYALLKKRFDEAHIEIPYPTTVQIHRHESGTS